MRPKPIVQFELLLLLALAIDFANNLLNWSGVSQSLVERGVAPNPAIVLLFCLASPIVGLIFWYFIARRRSVVAKWLLAAFVAISVIGFIVTGLRGVPPESVPLFATAAVAELLKIAAVSRLFSAGARPWFARDTTGSTPA